MSTEPSFSEQIIAIFCFQTSVGVLRTILFPMLDISALFASVAVLYAILDGRFWLFIIVSVVAVGTKEVFAISGLTYALYHLERPRFIQFIAIITPIVTFSAIRTLLGGDALEVNYSFNILQGEFPAYGQRLFSIQGIAFVILETILAGGILWFGVFAWKNRFISIAILTYILPMVIATWLLSSRIARPLVVIVPVLIIGCILLIRNAKDIRREILIEQPDDNFSTIDA